MDSLKDTYRTLSRPSEQILFKEKKSKFFGYAFPIQQEDEVKPIIEALRKKHHTAGHVCYAWQLGIADISYRANDDGEPNNSAGLPIYGQIQSFEVTNVLVAVARVFGGTKLGVGGLISAYRTGAQLALDTSQIVVKIVADIFELRFGYSEMDVVMRVIKQGKYEVVSQQLEATCKLVVSIRKSQTAQFQKKIEAIHQVAITRKE